MACFTSSLNPYHHVNFLFSLFFFFFSFVRPALCYCGLPNKLLVISSTAGVWPTLPTQKRSRDILFAKRQWHVTRIQRRGRSKKFTVVKADDLLSTIQTIGSPQNKVKILAIKIKMGCLHRLHVKQRCRKWVSSSPKKTSFGLSQPFNLF